MLSFADTEAALAILLQDEEQIVDDLVRLFDEAVELDEELCRIADLLAAEMAQL